MKNFEDAIGSFFSNNHRYIKLDGSGYFSGRLKSIFERAHFNAGATAVAGLLALDYLTQSNYSTLDSDTLTNLFKNSAVMTILSAKTYAMGYLAERKQKKNTDLSTNIFPHRDKAIDTTGRSLSRANLTEREIEGMRFGSKILLAAPIIQIPAYYFVLSGIYDTNGLIVHSAMTLGNCMSGFNRTNKLIKGHNGEANGYVFCDQPPANPQKQKASSLSFGGVTSPTP